MSLLSRNILANLTGGVWIAGLYVAVTPLQLKLLGVEAYGLVGLITFLQIALSAFDLGLSATATRIVATDKVHISSKSNKALDAMVTFYWTIALVMAVVLWNSSAWIATHWLTPSRLEEATVITGVKAIGIFVALRWPVAIYAGLITGSERLDVLNILKIGAISVRLLGGIAVLLAGADVRHFLFWFVISAGLEVLAYAITSHILIPTLSVRPRISVSSLEDIWKFSVAMNVIGLTSLLLTQVDRLIISTFLGLEALGFYTLAYNTAHGISLLQNAINHASFPAFTRASAESRAVLQSRYLKTSELMAYCYGLPCWVVLFFGHDILNFWIDKPAANGAYQALIALQLGFFFNAMASGGYLVSIASGQPLLPLKVNVLGALVYVPLLYVMIVSTGIVGAGICWTILNLYYVAVLVPTVGHSMLNLPFSRWLRRCLLPYAIAGVLVFGLLKLVAEVVPRHWWLCAALGALLYARIGFQLLSKTLRADIIAVLPRYFAARS